MSCQGSWETPACTPVGRRGSGISHAEECGASYPDSAVATSVNHLPILRVSLTSTWLNGRSRPRQNARQYRSRYMSAVETALVYCKLNEPVGSLVDRSMLSNGRQGQLRHAFLPRSPASSLDVACRQKQCLMLRNLGEMRARLEETVSDLHDKGGGARLLFALRKLGRMMSVMASQLRRRDSQAMAPTGWTARRLWRRQLRSCVICRKGIAYNRRWTFVAPCRLLHSNCRAVNATIPSCGSLSKFRQPVRS